MSSFARRLQRQLNPSQAVHYPKDLDGKIIVGSKPYANPMRKKFYGKNLFHAGRGAYIGITNQKCKARAARLARDAKWGRVS